MPDQNDPRAKGTRATPVPDLIERYRVRRDAWIAQADELARLRDEVRGAAEREAMEIVTAARRDVRQVIMEARRELLVLSAQVQAALGENGRLDPSALLNRGASQAGSGMPSLAAGDRPTGALVPQEAVKTMLDEARADMEALARDAKTVPFQATTLASGPVVDHPAALPRGSAVETPPPSLLDAAHVRAFDSLPKKTFEFAPSKMLDPASAKTFDVSPTRPFDTAQGKSFDSAPAKPFDSAPAKPFDSAPVKKVEFTQARPFESTQSKPFDAAQGKPFDLFQSKPLDLTQGKSSEQVQTRSFDFPQGRPPVERRPIDSMKGSTLSDSPGKDDSYRSDVIFESVARLAAARSTESSTSSVLLSSAFPSDSVAVPAGRSLRTFVALLAVVGVLSGGSYWWLRGRTSTPDSDTRARTSEPAGKIAASSPPAATAPIVPVKESKAEESKPSPLSVSVEARRSSWIKATVDGKSDDGRMYAAGETLQLNADRGIMLRVGDAGAVYVSVNKGAPTVVGRNGVAATRQFVVGSLPENAPPAAARSVAAPPIVASVPIPGLPPSQTPPKVAAGSPFPPIPVPLVQTPPFPNTPPVQPSPAPAPVTRNESPSVPLPRTEAATVPPPPAPVPAPNTAVNNSPTNAIVSAARQWLEAYQRQERSAMAALSTDGLQLADERRADEKFPAGVAVSRSLDRVSVQIAADTAVLTAVMTEKGDAGTHVSPVSQVWVLSGGQWRVRQVRLVSEARLNQIFR
ncbi:MAG TPA: RodZ domain-containing protein [Vicinamibacterales bacterium]|nr:RodZ domain-containing protein [Vicinamibacterales bacterium]